MLPISYLTTFQKKKLPTNSPSKQPQPFLPLHPPHFFEKINSTTFHSFLIHLNPFLPFNFSRTITYILQEKKNLIHSPFSHS